ncbi:YdeI/OmpD-associated family protein [Sporosarcina sp. Marseille-Q4943]|uniref:YdeI/OmpD-associated family protein n=1 Tax=Sporosarcina sp. Marseille-Q4943 TaxID=2942204 RepID=UPI00208DA3DD|nr:YdeI/OmpD-associated family protein [Sporosarcina sp. Marseille-Q4943]
MNSEKTIIEKLGLHKYERIAVLNKPDDIDEFKGLSYDVKLKKESYQCVFIFIFTLDQFAEQAKLLIEKRIIENNGYAFFAYPKKGNKQHEQYIERDLFYENLAIDEDGYLSGSDLKFSRMVSLNEVFTVVGLKAVKKKAATKGATPASQCVDDYIVHIDDIKTHLSSNEAILGIYNALTFGYQKDWARYVYSAKRQETQEKRLAEMEMILAEGYKSKDLYRQKK